MAHGGVIASLVGLLFGVLPNKPRRLGNVANTAMTTIDLSGGHPTLLAFNDATHVAPLPSWGQDRLERGATVVALVPESFEYDAPVTPLADADLREHLSGLARERPGERLGVSVDEERWRHYATSVLGESVRLGPPSGATHVVVSERGHTLADLNVGPWRDAA